MRILFISIVTIFVSSAFANEDILSTTNRLNELSVSVEKNEDIGSQRNKLDRLKKRCARRSGEWHDFPYGHSCIYYEAVKPNNSDPIKQQTTMVSREIVTQPQNDDVQLRMRRRRCVRNGGTYYDVYDEAGTKTKSWCSLDHSATQVK